MKTLYYNVAAIAGCLIAFNVFAAEIAQTAAPAAEPLIPELAARGWHRPAGCVVEGKSVKLTPQKGKVGTGTVVSLKAGSNYEFSFTIEANGSFTKDDLIQFVSGYPNSFCQLPVIPGKNKFRTFISCKTNDKKWVNIIFKSKDPAKSITVSNVELKELDPAKALVLNDAMAWSINSWCAKYTEIAGEEVADHIDEGNALAITLTNPPKNGSGSLRTTGMFPLAPESEYEITVWVKANGATSAGLGVDTWLGKNYKHYYNINSFQVGTEWKKETFRFKTPSVKDQPVFENGITHGAISFKAAAGANKFYFKDWTIKKVK